MSTTATEGGRTAISSSDITVCIVVKDRLDLMETCLSSIDAQVSRPGAIVVVDNGSSDGTYGMLLQRAAATPSMTVISNKGSLGAIRNLAVRAAGTELVAFIDSDCVASPRWILELVAEWNLHGPKLAALQGCTLPDPTHPAEWWSTTQTINAFSGRYEACNIAYLRSALLSTPGFDERIGYLGEDTAAGWYLERAGWETAFASDALVHHAVVASGLRGQLRKTARYGKVCRLIKLFPEKRNGLTNRIFLNKRTRATWFALLAFVLLLGGIVTAAITVPKVGGVGWLWVVAGVLFARVLLKPWATRAWPKGSARRAGLRALWGRALIDLTMVISLALGSLRHRCLVL